MADIDELAGRLDHELPDVRWDEPGAIRARGRGRTRRQSAVLAALSVLVITAGIAWWAPRSSQPTPAAPPSPAPTATPSTGSGPTTAPVVDGSTLFPVSALLGAEDVGTGYQVTNQHGYGPGTYPAWAFGADDCPEYDALKVTAYKSYLWFRHQNLELAGAPSVFTQGARYPKGVAKNVLADVDRVTAACKRWEYAGGEASTDERPTVVTTTYTVVAKNFAGEEARLVRKDVISRDQDGKVVHQGTLMTAIVRVEDLVGVVELEIPEPDLMRSFGQRIADRMCGVADQVC
ncbi:hypothetical protein [Asanoa iriomotensis]|uniref:PknH-like protein n=1 Tax=Asanoa iriomotensis TaxID=234613 RepID=A0ABQ4CAU6_9ACTN|nr:hypothetical protein [Asanoa iriomotensis]GIF59901.1 hypothetical protein Air01nite_59960 [Asanoa iriomotensis]